MAVKSVWKGTLKIGLVMLPAKLVAAVEPEDKVRFNMLHRKCGGRLRSKSWCPACNEELDKGESMRGFEIRKGEYVVIEDNELEAVADEASSLLDVSSVTTDPIDPLRIDSTLYLVPTDASMQQAFETLRMAVGDRVAVGTMILRKKSCHVALQSAGRAFIVYKLRPDDQVRDFDSIAADLGLAATPKAPNPSELQMATQLIDGMIGSFSYEEVENEYDTRLRAFIEAKDSGKVTAMPAPRKAANVTSLADALAASLAAVQPKAAPAKAKMAKAEPVKAARRKTA